MELWRKGLAPSFPRTHRPTNNAWRVGALADGDDVAVMAALAQRAEFENETNQQRLEAVVSGDEAATQIKLSPVPTYHARVAMASNTIYTFYSISFSYLDSATWFNCSM